MLGLSTYVFSGENITSRKAIHSQPPNAIHINTGQHRILPHPSRFIIQNRPTILSPFKQMSTKWL